METIYNLIGIGIGPFNLGLAALASMIPDLNCLFFDQLPEFNWHPGLMIENARLQVPFLADLVTLADPTNPFSYICFLKANNRLTRFAIHENYYPTRKEYNQYCRWVAGQLTSLHFGICCDAIHFNEKLKCYDIHLLNQHSGIPKMFHAKHLAIGIGTEPNVPDFISGNQDLKHANIFHSAEYIYRKPGINLNSSVTIVGSGQSAAEIFYDLLKSNLELKSLNWFTKSDRFYPMEYSKLTLEMTSPDYIDYFFKLTPEQKEKTLAGQDMLYKGINFVLINEIYDELYMQSVENDKTAKQICTHCSLIAAEMSSYSDLVIQFNHTGKSEVFTHKTNTLILATGYKSTIPSFLDSIKERIQMTDTRFYTCNRDYSIDHDHSIFVQNGDLHSHGFNSADLGMGPYRNAVILNTILGREHFKLEKNIAFQRFGISNDLIRGSDL